MGDGKGLSLRAQLLLAFLLPTSLLFGWLSLRTEALVRSALEASLAERLVAIASAAAATQSPRVLVLGPGDDATRTKGHAQARLEQVRSGTGVARLLLVRLPEHTVLVDTAGELPVGAPYHRAEIDRPEIERVAAGEGSSSLLFIGEGGRTYKTGYAPMRDDEGAVRAYVAAAAAADYPQALDRLRTRLLGSSGVGLALLGLIGVGLASRLARPLGRLSTAALGIGVGREVSIPVDGSRESRQLGETMRWMAEALRKREEERQLMLAGIAHEVRNPLGGIELFAGLLREDLEDDPRRAHVDRILTELGALSAVVNDFLAFARRSDPDLAEVELPTLLEEVKALVEAGAGSRGVTVRVEACAPTTFVLDRDMIRRAVLNLVRNGVEAASREVRVFARAAPGGLELVVDDDGPGVPREARSELFAPFFTTKQRGTGLGLALVERAAEAHRGRVEVDTSPLGGARFVLGLGPPAPALEIDGC